MRRKRLRRGPPPTVPAPQAHPPYFDARCSPSARETLGAAPGPGRDDVGAAWTPLPLPPAWPWRLRLLFQLPTSLPHFPEWRAQRLGTPPSSMWKSPSLWAGTPAIPLPGVAPWTKWPWTTEGTVMPPPRPAGSDSAPSAARPSPALAPAAGKQSIRNWSVGTYSSRSSATQRDTTHGFSTPRSSNSGRAGCTSGAG